MTGSAMDLARYVADAVVLERRSYREVARAHGVSKSYVGKVVGRFRSGGYDAIAHAPGGPSRSRAARPKRSMTRSSPCARS
jgi:transposase